jgi:HK97 family phage portal protein
MGVLRSLFSRFAGKSTPSTYTLDEYAARFARAEDVTDDPGDNEINVRQPYIQSVWVRACVDLIANSVARVPFVLRRLSDREIVTDTPLNRLMERPNPEQNGVQFVAATIGNLLLDGHVFLEPRDIADLRPGRLHVHPLRKFAPDVRQNEFGDDFAFRWIRVATQEPLIPGDEIFEWKLLNPYDDVYGCSPLAAAMLAIYCDIGTGVYNKYFFKNGAKPGLVFSTDDERFTAKQADEALSRWNAKHQGATRGHKVAFMGNGLKPHVVGYTYADMEMPALKQMSKSEILAIYHVPETLLGAQPKATGVQIGGDRKPDEENFMLNVVQPWAAQFCWWFDHVVTSRFGPYYTEFDFRQVAVLQDRLLERAKEGREWCKMGATFNDVNQLFDLGFKPQPTGDDWWVPSNMLPARLLMDGPIAAEPPEKIQDSEDAKDRKKAIRVVA